ncbi:Glycosyl transferase [Cinnamomum micranthum f. kanehirae]|uniref:Glycosyl transferase n=1 Tax=Cinnamomum micranthum f. kanehirae TaxID=337451 RepID=A0A443N124_9MAGN|nr:Glycosyl transferase [Cinnamomum micranthum f. kanehirae]
MASSSSTTTTTIFSPFSLPSTPHRFPKSLKYPIISPPTRRLRISSCLAVDPTDDNLSTPSLHPDDDDLRIVFAAGGTGGHIYPAIAIADDFKLLHPAAKILFLGTGSGMESISAPSAGFDFAAVPAVALARPLLSPLNLVFPFRLLKCVLASYRKLRDIRPRVVVGTGGYVAAPVCLAAALSGVKVVIQEQNSVPGLANRLLGLFADKVFVSFESSSTYFPTEKCEVSGNPVRASLRRYTSKAVARMHFFPREAVSGAQVLLVLGGSLGANSINIAVLNMYYQMLMEHKNRFVIWQTGVAGFDEMESLVRNHPRLLLTPFLHTMDLAYAGADLVVSRAGAMTCSEILATGKPSILIPSPNVAEGHQIRNAYIMENIAGSRIILEEELDSTTLGSVIDGILGDESEMALMSEKAMKAARPDASAQIAQHILSLAKLPAQTTK